MRTSLVPIDQMRDKAVHAANGFHYSGWGAHPVVASGDDLKPEDKYGFDMIGSDGLEHSQPKGYYKLDIVIPDVVPDGKYMLAWAWFGGVDGKIKATPQEPETGGYFADYWSCSFVLVEGGAPLAASYMPKFVNDMPQWSSEGCIAHADDVGQCPVEHCRHRKGHYRKPAAFLGNGPKPITLANFGGTVPDAPPKETPPVDTPRETPAPVEDGPAPSPEYSPPTDPGKMYFDRGSMSCLCIAGSSDMCFKELTAYSQQCVAHEAYYNQPKACSEACCELCKKDDSFSACQNSETRRVCSLLA